MIKILIALSHKFKFIDNWLAKLVEEYGFQEKKESIPLLSKEQVEELCRGDLQRVVAYEKEGNSSGFPKPRIVPQPR